MSKHTITHSGTTVAYWSYHDESQPVIVMVHGFRGTHHGLERIVEKLPQYHIVVPDLPGFGSSEPLATTHSLDAYVAFLRDFIEQLQLSQPPILLGHSFGSIIVSHYAAMHPQTIDKLILVNPIAAPALKGPKAAMTQLAIFYYWLGRKLPAKASHTWLSAKPIVKIMSVTMAKTKHKPTLDYIHEQHLTHFSSFASPAVVAEAFQTSVSHDVRQVADRIATPTLLIAGERDDITALPKQQELADHINGAVLVVIPDVGHLIHYETAEAAAQAVTNFVSAPTKSA